MHRQTLLGYLAVFLFSFAAAATAKTQEPPSGVRTPQLHAAADAASPESHPTLINEHGLHLPLVVAVHPKKNAAGASAATPAAASAAAGAADSNSTASKGKAQNELRPFPLAALSSSSNKDNSSNNNKDSSSNSSSKANEPELMMSWWDVAILSLLGVLLLCSSLAFISETSFHCSLLKRISSNSSIGRLLEQHNRNKLKLQLLANEYEKVTEERARIAPLWFFARQKKDKEQLAALRRQAEAADETLAQIRRRYAEAEAQSGFFRLCLRWLWSGRFALPRISFNSFNSFFTSSRDLNEFKCVAGTPRLRSSAKERKNKQKRCTSSNRNTTTSSSSSSSSSSCCSSCSDSDSNSQDVNSKRRGRDASSSRSSSCSSSSSSSCSSCSSSKDDAYDLSSVCSEAANDTNKQNNKEDNLRGAFLHEPSLLSYRLQQLTNRKTFAAQRLLQQQPAAAAAAAAELEEEPAAAAAAAAAAEQGG